MVARFLRESGFNAEVLPLVHVGGSGLDPDQVRRLVALAVGEREPSRVRALFGGKFCDSLMGCAHQAVGVRFSSDGVVRLFIVDFLLPQLFGGRGCDLDYVFDEVDPGCLLDKYGLVVVSAKFVKFPRVSCRLFEVDGSLALDLSDDYAAFKRMVEAVRAAD
ncbi:MAG: hypothetical protein V1875_06695 [Candidatus Altiarchaeota archaeon]